MELWVKAEIGEVQAGLPAGKSSMVNIYTIQQIREKKKAKNKYNEGPNPKAKQSPNMPKLQHKTGVN